jgi:D-sedoheptulose 7-phosphate isomerase
MNFSERYLLQSKVIIEKLDIKKIELVIKLINEIRQNKGRIFFLGVGGSSANASHAVNDFRKITGIECYAPTDNMSEISARTNDEGWSTVFIEWLKISKLNKKDLIFILSVGGGNEKKNISQNIVEAIKYAKVTKSKIAGIVGKDGGFTKKNSKYCILIPVIDELNITPHTESFQSIIWHLMVSHPKLKKNQTKWESIK